jgi:hypothetical protein
VISWFWCFCLCGPIPCQLTRYPRSGDVRRLIAVDTHFQRLCGPKCLFPSLSHEWLGPAAHLAEDQQIQKPANFPWPNIVEDQQLRKSHFASLPYVPHRGTRWSQPPLGASYHHYCQSTFRSPLQLGSLCQTGAGNDRTTKEKVTRGYSSVRRQHHD